MSPVWAIKRDRDLPPHRKAGSGTERMSRDAVYPGNNIAFYRACVTLEVVSPWTANSLPQDRRAEGHSGFVLELGGVDRAASQPGSMPASLETGLVATEGLDAF